MQIYVQKPADHITVGGGCLARMGLNSKWESLTTSMSRKLSICDPFQEIRLNVATKKSRFLYPSVESNLRCVVLKEYGLTVNARRS